MSRKRKGEITIHITPDQFFTLQQSLATIDASIGGGDEGYNDWAIQAVEDWDDIIIRNKLNPTFKLYEKKRKNDE